ncbi:glycerate kinase [Corynebacterium sp. 3HC-13]|uniref:glycerate kinase n=1 Tax=Corynebacterium poyangense TaxID=2684405 RepID=UPI001CD023B3|nr:glycerate kinase [Corynebacterium poyangense]MBZ8178089.1 glycerate kinase [Corynebacterium poyangense]
MASPRIVICPDSLKGTATASDAAQFLAEGIHQLLPHADIVCTPLADGGEGTAEILGGEEITLPTTNAVGRLSEATYYWDAQHHTAHIDIAAASGLPEVSDNLQPLRADTYGTGVLIADACTRGATTIVLCLGGSATTDGGTGIMVALGAQPLDSRGYPVAPGGGHLSEIVRFNITELNVPAAAVEWELLGDVTSPAIGEHGAAHVFGQQKGASEEEVLTLDAGIAHLCDVLDIDPQLPRLGAAGAAGVGVLGLSRFIHGNDEHVRLKPGAATVMEKQRLADAISQADVVISAEGALDSQSFSGKIIGNVAELTAQHGVPMIVVAGKVDQTLSLPQHLSAYQLPPGEVSWQLREAGKDIARSLSQQNS